MTQEEKQLLIKDLTARQSYGVKLYHEDDWGDNIGKLESININDDECVIWNYNGTDTDIFDIEDVKPFLRPMSSITEEERKELFAIEDNMQFHSNSVYSPDRFDFYTSRHFDYRGLIEKGLALQAPEGMYNF